MAVKINLSIHLLISAFGVHMAKSKTQNTGELHWRVAKNLIKTTKKIGQKRYKKVGAFEGKNFVSKLQHIHYRTRASISCSCFVVTSLNQF